MPSMDFSEVLAAPEFTDTITITSATRTIGTDGVAVLATTTTTDATAVVIPGKASLRRLDDGTRVSAYIDVYTQAALSMGGRIDNANERVADVVTWHGRTYVVAAVEDYSAFASGFVKASCDLVILNPTAS